MATARLPYSPSDYAALVRVPNLFTAPPDVLAGVALTLAAGSVDPAGIAGATVTAGVTDPAFGLGDVLAAAVASALVYAGGTTLNDYFDADEDAAERPERPIPSGRISRSAAFTLGMTLLAIAVIVALFAGPAAAVITGALIAVVLLYDGLVKDGPAGPPTMGAARGLNVALGVAAVGPARLPTWFGFVPPWLAAAPVAVALYITGVTAMAETETVGGDRRVVLVAGAGALLAAVVAVLVAVVAGARSRRVGLVALFAGAFLVAVVRPLRRAYADPVPERVGPAVGASILWLVVLDAAFAATGGIAWALVTLAFLVPAVGLSRVFDVT